MPIPSWAHCRLGPHFLVLDEAQQEFGNPPYRHHTRSLLNSSVAIQGQPGARNINPDQLRWDSTEFVGEGQISLKADDEVLAHRFYLSEGLDFRTPGQFKLNLSTVVQAPADSTGGATDTDEGDTWTDVTGTSVVVNTTDRRLAVVNDEIQGPVFTPGASQVQSEFFIYNEGIQYTTIEGSAMILKAGAGSTDGTDFRLHKEGSVARTADAAGTGLTAAKPREVNWYVFKNATSQAHPSAKFLILNVTGQNEIVVHESPAVKITETTSTLAYTTSFTPASGKVYQFRTVYYNDRGENVRLIIDKVTHGQGIDPNITVRVSIWNDSGAAEVSGTVKTVTVANTSTLNIVNVTWTAAAATNYKARVRYTVGNQRPIVDKTIQRTQATGAWTFDDIELGLGGNIILAGHRSGAASNFWKYNFSTDAWTEVQSLTGATNITIRALAHTDKWQYFLGSDGIVYQADAVTTDNDYIAAVTGAVGMAICQNRMFILSEDATNGVDVATYAVDADVSVAVTAQLATTEVSSGLNTADTGLRQRMVGTPTGARFFLNFSDVTSVIYEADTSTGALVVSEIARLDVGAKATCISYAGGLTFIGGQMLAETGETPISTLWAIDQQDQLVRVGDFRPTDPDANAPQKMVPYDTSLWILQGAFVWRYFLRTGGLFCEYELAASDATKQMGIAVVKNHQFALFSGEGSHTTGSVGTYRSAGTADSNRWTSSVNDFGLPGVTKQLDFIEVSTDTLPASTSVSIEYQKNQSGTWVALSTLTSGSKHRITSDSGQDTVTFETLQLRVTLQSLTGVNTPTVRAISARAFPAEFEEFFDLLVNCNDEDSVYRVQGRQVRGHEIAQAIIDMQKSKETTTLEFGYHADRTNPVGAQVNIPVYLVRVEDFDRVGTKQGESSMRVRLRVLDAP